MRFGSVSQEAELYAGSRVSSEGKMLISLIAQQLIGLYGGGAL